MQRESAVIHRMIHDTAFCIDKTAQNIADSTRTLQRGNLILCQQAGFRKDRLRGQISNRQDRHIQQPRSIQQLDDASVLKQSISCHRIWSKTGPAIKKHSADNLSATRQANSDVFTFYTRVSPPSKDITFRPFGCLGSIPATPFVSVEPQPKPIDMSGPIVALK